MRLDVLARRNEELHGACKGLKKEVADIMDRLASIGATDMLNFNLSNYR